MKRTAALLIYAASVSSSFSFSSLGRERKSIYLHRASVETTSDVVERNSNTYISSRWATNALLFSSWNDGIVPSLAAKKFMKYAICAKLLQDHIAKKEDNIEESAKYSPCNGPSVDALNNLEIADRLNKSGKQFSFDNFVDTDTIDLWTKETLQYITSESEQITVKLLYIPTAMYALNPQSSNTPGKQRQRARSDGKKRRTQVLKLLETMLSDEISTKLSIQTITLDLDDDSLKQPEGPDTAPFPQDGREALSSWNPTCIYVEGGNTFWLQHCIEKGEYSQYIVDACTGESGSVYCGKSAGAIVAGNDMSTASWKCWDNPSVVPSKQTYEDWVGTKGFQFAESISFFPHMDDQWIELVNGKLKGQEAGSTYCLREEEVCCINGERKKSFVVSGDAIR